MTLVHTRAFRLLLNRQCRIKYFRALQYSNLHNQQGNENNRKNAFTSSPLLISALISSVGYYFFVTGKGRLVVAEEAKKHVETNIRTVAGRFRPDLPSYSMEEVSKHTTKEDQVWVVYREGVYDITDFIEQHPGGEQIMIAAGSSVEPFWVLYGIHVNDHVFKVLETLRIGNLSKSDIVNVADVGDPYAKDPIRHSALKPANMKPFNAEISPTLLCESFITPNELFYIRNHLPVPEIDPDKYELELEVEGTDRKVVFSLDDLKKFPKATIIATLMCAGNRRAEMKKVKAVKGLDWGPCAIGNATWSGVRLRDLLKQVGVTEDEEKLKHVQFEGLDLDVTATQYGASIPIWKAVDRRGDVILAYEMNGVPIPADHGYPLRVVVPGVAGARNVKWLGKIVVSEKESDSHWQQNDYKGFSPSTDYDNVDFSKAPAIQELPVISAICKPSHGETVKVENGYITVKGYAWSGGGQKIVRVDLTLDEGKTWHVANLDAQDTALPPQHWAWTLWSVKLPVEQELKEVEVWCKAVDSCYNTQPEKFEHIWNFRGVLSNAYHRVKIKLNQ